MLLTPLLTRKLGLETTLSASIYNWDYGGAHTVYSYHQKPLEWYTKRNRTTQACL